MEYAIGIGNVIALKAIMLRTFVRTASIPQQSIDWIISRSASAKRIVLFGSNTDANSTCYPNSSMAILNPPKSKDIALPQFSDSSVDILIFADNFHLHATPRTYMECRRILSKDKQPGTLALCWNETRGVDSKWKEVWEPFLGQYYGSLEHSSRNGCETFLTRVIC